MTGDIDRRMEQHLEDRDPKSFVSRYNLDRLVFMETYPTADQAFRREKQLKGWSRARKKALIFEQNPTRRNLIYD
jgi:putative endonuclease